MSILSIGRCGLYADRMSAGIPFWFGGACVGRLAVNDDVNDDTMYLTFGVDIDNDTCDQIKERAEHLSRTGDKKIIRIIDVDVAAAGLDPKRCPAGDHKKATLADEIEEIPRP